MIETERVCKLVGATEGFCRFLAETLPGLTDRNWWPHLPPMGLMLLAVEKFLSQAAQIGSNDALWICGKLSNDVAIQAAIRAVDIHAQRVEAGETVPSEPGHTIFVFNREFVNWSGHPHLYRLADKQTLAIDKHIPQVITAMGLSLENCYLDLRKRSLE